MKDWSKERWRKLYLREALEQRLWSVMARGLRDYLIRLAEDDGALIRDADDPLKALLAVLGAHSNEVELVRAALVVLLQDGFLAGGARSIFVRNLPAAQSWEPPRAVVPELAGADAPASGSSSTERVRRHRERARQQARNANESTEQDAGRAVTGVPEPVSDTVTSSVPAVTSTVSCNVPFAVTTSRGSPNPDPSGSFLDLQRDKQRDLPPSSERASSVTGNVSSGVASRSRNAEEDKEERSNVPQSREDAQRLGIAARAALVIGQPALATLTQPERWPEVESVAQVFALAVGKAQQRLGRYERDPGVRALVELYAAGFTQLELERVAEVVPKQAWWSAAGKRLGLSSLSIEVVRRNLPGNGPQRSVSPQVAKVLERVRQRREAG